MFEKWFHLKERNTDVKTELLAGVTTFLAMAHILAVNPKLVGLRNEPRRCVDRDGIGVVCRNRLDGCFGELSVCVGARHGAERVFRFYGLLDDGLFMAFRSDGRLCGRHHLPAAVTAQCSRSDIQRDSAGAEERRRRRHRFVHRVHRIAKCAHCR